jgi:hypothetical protein
MPSCRPWRCGSSRSRQTYLLTRSGNIGTRWKLLLSIGSSSRRHRFGLALRTCEPPTTRISADRSVESST